MTSIAVTASNCASAAEVALLVASFMPVFSLNLGATIRGAKTRNGRQNFTLLRRQDIGAMVHRIHNDQSSKLFIE